MNKKQFAMAAALGLSMSGCGLVDDLVANLQEKLLGSLNVDSSSLQDVVGQATGNFAAAGDTIGDYVNLENEDAQEAAKSFQPDNRGGNTGFAPGFNRVKQYLSLNEDAEADLDCIEITKNDEGTEVKENYDACDGITGSIITTLESNEGEEIVKLKFEEYTVGVSTEEDYEYLNGTQKWTVSFLKGGGIKMQASNTYDGATFKRPQVASFTDQISFTFSDGLLVDGTSTIIQGTTTAILRFSEVTFDECAFGPDSGSLDMTIGADKIEVKVTECGSGSLIETVGGTTTTDELTSDEVSEFFDDVNTNLDVMETSIDESAGGAASCNAPVSNANLKKYEGFWCEAFPQGTSAWLNCVKICNVDETKSLPDFYNFGGIATLKDGHKGIARDVMGEEMGFITHDFDIACVEPFAFIRGVVEYKKELTVKEKKYDQVAPDFGFDDLALPGEEFPEGDFPEGDFPDDPMMMPLNTMPEFTQAWRMTGANSAIFGVWDVFADGSGTNSLWAFDAFKKVDGNPRDFPPCTEEDYSALESAAADFDWCATEEGANDPYCSDADPYCLEFPEDPTCAGAVDCETFPDDPFCGGGMYDTGSETWCVENPGDLDCGGTYDCFDPQAQDGVNCGVLQ